jgi:hypothetical protein
MSEDKKKEKRGVLMLDVDQAGELKAAFRRYGWTNKDIKKLCESAILDGALKVLHRQAFIKIPNDFIIFHVAVNRKRNPMETIDATGWTKRVDPDVVAAMPRGEGDEIDVVFFEIRRSASNEDLEKEYEVRGLKPADPYSLIAVNAENPAFTDKHLNSTQWKDADDKWCSATCARWPNEYCVGIGRQGGWCAGPGWYAGIPK